MEARTRRRWGAALLAALLAALAWWLWPDAPGDSDMTAPLAQDAPLEILRFDGGPRDGGEGEAFLVTFDARGQLVRSVDAGPPPPHPPATDVLVDTCEEPVEEEPPAPEGWTEVSRDGVRVAYDGAPPSLARAILDDAVTALEEAAAWIAAPRRETLLVVAHPDPESMAAALGGPSWASAAYDGAVHVVADRFERSLRHEVLHAQLHFTAPCVPYWLDEGLASRFERAGAGRAFEWLRMIHLHTWIPLASLAEPLMDDEGAERMTPPEVGMLYAQAYAMASMLDERGGEDAVPRAVRAAAGGMPRALLWDTQMPGVDGERLLDWLASKTFPTVPPDARPALEGAGYACRTQEDGAPVCEPR